MVQVEDDTDKENNSVTSIGGLVFTRQRDGCKKDRKIDINETNIRVEEYRGELNRQGEGNCEDDKNKVIMARRRAVILKRQSE